MPKAESRKPKADTAAQVRQLTDIPNIGVSMAQDLMGLSISTPVAVKSMDPVASFDALRSPMGHRHDPCVLDAFLAAKEFMNGAPRRPWWDFTEQRKVMLKTLNWK